MARPIATERPEHWKLDLTRNAARRMRFAAAALESAADAIEVAADVVGHALARGNKVVVFGNGGSAACAQHFAAEFTGKLCLDRVPLPAISLTVDTSALTAIANDYGYEDVFSRQVRALCKPGDVAVGLSTSGTSRNVREAISAANDMGVETIALTGKRDELGARFSVQVPLIETARVQEAHDLVLHQLAQIAERIVVSELDDDASADAFPFVLERDQLSGFRSWLASSNQTLVTTNGVFDLFHRGHESSLQAARVHGDRLVVFVNSDESVQRLKGPERPVRALADRLEDLRRSPYVDHVIVMMEDDPVALLQALRPEVHTKGADYVDKVIPEQAVVAEYGGRVEYLPLLGGYSTTDQIARADV